MTTPVPPIPNRATHPGSLIKDELEARAMSQKDLAHELDVLPSFLNEIIKGKRPVTADFAILLESTLGIGAEYWMRLQSQFDIDEARIREKNIKKIQHIDRWNLIKQSVPVNYLKKMGYLTNSVESDIAMINSIYRTKSVDDIVEAQARETVEFYRKSEKLKIEPSNIFAWSRLAEYEAAKQRVLTFLPENIPSLCLKLNKVFYENKGTLSKVQKTLNQYGIVCIYLEKPPKTPVDGYAFWSGNNPAIALTLRYKRLDNFAFTLLHEIGHIALHLENRSSKFIDMENDSKHEKVEREADNFAQNSLIPNAIWKNLKHEDLSDSAILAFAAEYKIHPAIILGRKCYESGNYNIRTNIDRSLG